MLTRFIEVEGVPTRCLEAGDPGAPPGDLYVQVTVEDDPAIERDGLYLYVRVDLTVTQEIGRAHV